MVEYYSARFRPILSINNWRKIMHICPQEIYAFLSVYPMLQQYVNHALFYVKNWLNI